MNLLQHKQVEKLKELGCSDLARKVNEIVKWINEEIGIECEHDWCAMGNDNFQCNNCGKAGEIKEIDFEK